MENSNSIVSRETLDQAALWLSATVSSAFFTSLERFSCVNVATDDDDDEDDDQNDVVEARNDQLQLQNDVTKLPV